MDLVLPSRGDAKRRDRHGRGLRGPVLSPMLPGWRTRSESFDLLVARAAARLVKLNPGLRDVQFGVEEVPPSDPAVWEGRAVAVGRYFPLDRSVGAPARIVVYRRPLLTRALGTSDLVFLVRTVLAEQAAEALGRRPGEVDPSYEAD